MGIVAYTNDVFNYAEYIAEREQYLGADIPADTMTTIPEHMRLPGNIHIFDFLLSLNGMLKNFLELNNYAGENILFSPAYPDIIYSNNEPTGDETSDSPHVAIPPLITYMVRKRAPGSYDPPFGSRKMWKYRIAGEVKGADGKHYQIRMRKWESLVKFTAAARSGGEAEKLCYMFEHFMDLCEGDFLKLGIEKMAGFGRAEEPDETLKNAGMHHRITLYWFMTQEFLTVGPLEEMSTIEIEGNSLG